MLRTAPKPIRQSLSQWSVVDPDISEAEDAFAVLASRIRLQILQRLGEVTDQSVYTFTELYEAVDTANTSQFSYHLTELTGQYVKQTDDGYAISDAGLRIVQLVNAGEYTIQPEFDPVTVSTHCPYCDGTLAEARYSGLFATVDCLACENTLLRYDLRPAHVADRDSLQALKAADRRMRAELRTALDGVCQRCGGSVESELCTGPDVDPATALIRLDCQQCGTELSAPVKVTLLYNPDVISRAEGDDVGLMTTPTWELLETLSNWSIELDEPDSITLRIPEAEPLRIDLSAEPWNPGRSM